MNIPFESIDWSGIEKTEHKGETGTSWWQTVHFGGLRLRIVEYSPGYLADHWCRKGHIVHCLQGAFVSELQDGRTIALSEGGTYIVSDEMSSHRSVSESGVRLLIIDGDFLKLKGAGLLPEFMETERLRLAPMRISDASFIRQLLNTEGWIRFIGDRHIDSEAAAVAYIQRILGNPDLTYHVMRLRSEGTPIGITTLVKRPHLEQPDIGFALLPQYEGQGYSSEGMGAVLASLVGSGTLKKVQAITLPDNVRSIRLLERLGLSYQKDLMEGDVRLLVYGKELGLLSSLP
jgi:RimJ/RimL family protein N-acetyltransferase